MPQRFLRPGLRDSARFNACSFKAQSLYIRLLTLVDDYGRYDGRDAVIWAHCWAVWNDLHPQEQVAPEESAKLVVELVANHLWEMYEHDGKKILQMTQWSERARGESKWKLPKDAVPLRNPAESSGILPPSVKVNVNSQRPSPSSTPIVNVNERRPAGDLARKVAARILANADDWHYDNCKVNQAELKLRSLASVIELHGIIFDEKKLIQIWKGAVLKAHQAKVDGLAKNATAYCIAVFKDDLRQREPMPTQ